MLAAASSLPGVEIGRSAILLPRPGAEDCSVSENGIGGLLASVRPDDALLAVTDLDERRPAGSAGTMRRSTPSVASMRAS